MITLKCKEESESRVDLNKDGDDLEIWSYSEGRSTLVVLSKEGAIRMAFWILKEIEGKSHDSTCMRAGY